MKRLCVLVGIDVGGTATRLAIASGDGVVLGAGCAMGAGTTEVSPEESARRIRQGWLNACRAAGIPPQQPVDSLFAGFGSLASPADAGLARSCLRRAGILARRLRVGHDSENAHMGALGGRSGIHVIAGTGSVVSAVDRMGRAWRVGGWGPGIGDEGSAWWLACEGLRAVANTADRGLVAGRLEREMMKALEITHPRELLRAVFAEGMGRSEFAALARPLARLASRGDGDARRIMASGAAALGRQVASAAVMARLDSPIVTFSGGVFEHCPGYARQVVATVREQGISARRVRSTGSPLAGALLLARKQMLSRAPNRPEFERRFLRKINQTLLQSL